MAKSSSSPYVCSSCGAGYPKWAGKCNTCGEWGTVEENTTASGASASSGGKTAGLKTQLKAATVAKPARRVNDIDTTAHKHTPTGLAEFDRTLGGGLVKGQVILCAGPPGVGKSTLLLAVADTLAKAGKTVLYISGEESAEQITLRARRTGVNADDLFIADETDLGVIFGHIEQCDPDLIIVDSIQTVASPDIEGRAGGVAQVQECSSAITRVAKGRRMSAIIVGQVTKDGNVAGPKTLEHLVDTVLEFEGDRHTALRLLRTIKNRFGPADEVSCWEQTEDGIKEVADPSGLFLSDRDEPVPGTAVTVAMEGRRAILAEVQALVAPTNAPNPRRGVSGLDSARMAMLLAVTERHGRIKMYDKDSYLATVAGMKITEPAADLAACVAIASAAWEAPLPQDVVVIGEVALSGDIRSVSSIRQRLNEAARLGYKRALVPPGSPSVDGLVTIPVPHITRALAALRAMQPDTPRSSPEDEN